MSRQMKPLRSELLTTAGRTQPSQPAAVNRTEAPGQHSTQSAKTANTHISTKTLSEMLSNLTESEKENVLLAAGIFASTLSTMTKSGLARRARNQATGEVVLVFPSTLWTDELRLR